MDLINGQIMKRAAEEAAEAHGLDWLSTVQNLRMGGRILVQLVRLQGDEENN